MTGFSCSHRCHPPLEHKVNFLDVLWHLANFLAPACTVAALQAGACKLLWRRQLAPHSWARLTAFSALGGGLAAVLALVWTGHDGKMLGYGLLLLGTSLPLWWLMLRR